MRNKRTFAQVLVLVLIWLLLVPRASWGLPALPRQEAGNSALDGQAAGPALAPGTSFVYQGSLARDGEPVSGTCTLTFGLYDDSAAGSVLSAPLAQEVTLDGGLFSAILDFGPGVFDGQARWLEVTVLCPGDGAPTTLSRVCLAVTPYALRARSVPWTGLVGLPAGLADGDANTTYQAGFGLNLDGTIFSLKNRDIGDITAVNAGPGLAGGGDTGSVTLAADTNMLQARVGGNCLEGSAISSIGVTGTVTCEEDTASVLQPGNQLRLEGDTLHVVEGQDSGLDGDLLDGRDSAYHLNAGNLAGTLSTDRYSAYADLAAELYLDNQANDLARNNGERQITLNADLLDSLDRTFFLNASNIASGTLGAGYYSAWLDLQAEGWLGTTGGLAVSDGSLQPGLNAEKLSGLVSTAWQKRVATSCGAGSALRLINVDGTGACEVDDAASYVAGNQLSLGLGNVLNVLEGAGSDLNADLLDGQEGGTYHDAGLLTGGVSLARFSAWNDLGAEGYLDNLAGDLAQNNGQRQPNLNVDLLDSLDGAYFLNAGNWNAGTLDPARYSAYADLLAGGYLENLSGDLAQNNGTMQVNLNAGQLNSLPGTAYQQRVGGACPAGEALQAINEDGTVVCRTVGSGDITAVWAGTGLQGGAATGEATLAIDPSYVQRRVTNDCAVGEAIWRVEGSGAATCATAGGSGDIYAVAAGAGLTGGGLSGDVSLAADLSYVQPRVAGVCPDTDVISGINADGTVACTTAGTGDITAVLAGTGLTGGGSSGQINLSVNFAGTGATTIARSDHNHDSTYVNEGQAGSISSGMLVAGASLTEIADDDGAGSGLSADLVDGVTDDLMWGCSDYDTTLSWSVPNAWATAPLSCSYYQPRAGGQRHEVRLQVSWTTSVPTCVVFYGVGPSSGPSSASGTILAQGTGNAELTYDATVNSTASGTQTMYLHMYKFMCGAADTVTLTGDLMFVIWYPGS